MAASDPEEAHAGLVTCIDYVYAKAYFYNANVVLALWFKPASEINFSSALQAGTQSVCQAVYPAFQERVYEVTRTPLDLQSIGLTAKRPGKILGVFYPAERVGFEPTVPCGTRALQARALGRTMLPLHPYQIKARAIILA